MNAKFGAPWGVRLGILTVLVVVVLTGVSVIEMIVLPGAMAGLRGLAAVVPLSVLICSAPFVVRGYAISDRTLLVMRLFWATRIDLASLTSATADPGAMKRSVKIFGNDGLFVIGGLFWNKKLGRYRAFATDPKHSVVLRFVDRLIVVTPDDPERFVEAIIRRK
jgi:hypothetical protein